MSSVRSGSTMRSSSLRPWLSNRQRSTRSAFAEKSAKFVPRPSQVAPNGCGAPAESRVLALGGENNCSKRRNDKADLGNHALVQRPDRPAVPDIAAAVDGGIGVENFPPDAGKWNLDAIVPIDFGREIDDHDATLVGFAPLAQPCEDAAVGVVHHQPFEARRLTIECVQG